MRETAHDALMERVDEHGQVIGFSILGVSRFRKERPFEAESTAYQPQPVRGREGDEDGGYIADVPDLDACSAFGDTPEKALTEVEIAESCMV